MRRSRGRLMRTALTIAAKDLRQRIRDRSVFVIAFLVPFGLALIFNLTLANVNEESDFTTAYAVADLDGGDVAGTFVDTIRGLDFVKRLREVNTEEQAETLAEDGTVSAAFVIPAGFSERASSGQGGELVVLTAPDASIGALVARSLAESFASDLNAIQVEVATVLGGGPVHDPEDVRGLVERAREVPPTAVLQQDTAESRLFSSTTFYAVGMAVFFLFFTVEFGVRSLLEERQEGTLARLLVAPMRPAWIIAGKSIASFVVGIVSMTVLVVMTSLLLGAAWGDPLGVAVMILAGVLSAMGLTALVATLAETPAQAGSYASIAAVVLGLLGGTFFPISQGPALLANVSLLTPHAWLMRGFTDLAAGGGVADVLPAAGAVLAFAVVLGGLAVARSGRLVPR